LVSIVNYRARAASQRQTTGKSACGTAKPTIAFTIWKRCQRRRVMKTIMQTLFAAGLVATAMIGAPAGSNAQGVSIYGPNFEVDVGNTRYPNRRYYRDPYYRDYYNSYGAYSGPYRYYGQPRCPHNWTVQDGVCKPYRGY
jgi:hypothetical protein